MKPSIGKSASVEEPRTGVVRKYTAGAARESNPAASPEARPITLIRMRHRAGPSAARPSEAGVVNRSTVDRGWRCLEWPPQPGDTVERQEREATRAQPSAKGELLQQRGSEEWLPDSAKFVHRLSQLVAHGLGFERCVEACLRGRDAVLAVSSAGSGKIVAATGRVERFQSLLRRVGLE